MRKYVLAAIAAGFVTSSFADLVARNGANELRLMPGACSHGGILGQLREEWRPKFRKGQATIEGKLHFACWIDTFEGAYFVIWESGESSLLPITGFIEVPGI